MEPQLDHASDNTDRFGAQSFSPGDSPEWPMRLTQSVAGSVGIVLVLIVLVPHARLVHRLWLKRDDDRIDSARESGTRSHSR